MLKKDTNNHSNIPLLIIASAVVIIGLIYFADILTPLALAVFLWLTIDGAAQLVHTKYKFVPRKFALPLILIIVFLGLAAIVAFIGDYARSFAHDMGAYKIRIDQVIAGFYEKFPSLGIAPTIGELFEKVSPALILNKLGEVLKGFGSEALFVLIYVLSLFAAQASLPKKIVNIFSNTKERDRFVAIGLAIRKSMEAYLWVQTITGAMIAIACYILFLILGLKNALFWALLTFLLSYIPAIGGLVATLLPCVFALVQFTSILPSISILIITQIIQFVIGNIIQPRMTGDSLNISILMVFLSLAFWGQIWGASGMFLAVPISVMMMIIMAQFPSTRPLAILMSANGKPDVEIKLQRKAKNSSVIDEEK
ncbi:MAG: AI-2E family transporter [Caulobacterales bacterium]|nr:AI-2E family transporter [Caulobacterales bacterium]